MQPLPAKNTLSNADQKHLNSFSSCVIPLYLLCRCLSRKRFYISCPRWSLTCSIRCRGLKVLVDLLDEDYHEQADLVANALVGVGSVFELQVCPPFP